MTMLIKKPPKISQTNKISAINSGLIPACLIALTWVVRPNATIAIANNMVSKTMTCLTISTGTVIIKK